MPSRIGLMGLGRVGRNIFRLLYNQDDLQLVAINDPADHAGLAYLLRFDTLLGRFPAELRLEDGGGLRVAGRQVQMLSGKQPGDVDWAALGVDTVIEATEGHRTRAELERHLEKGAKRVILCSPAADALDATVVMGLNDGDLKAEHRIVSASSDTTNAAAPALSILQEAFGVQRGFVTTVHAYTSQQRLADVPADDPRRGRAAAENIIPQETDAAKEVEGLLPGLRGKLTGMSMNVPVANGSVVDLVCWHDQPVTVDGLNEAFKTAAASDRWKGLLEYVADPIVSSDILLSTYSGTYDSLATMVLGEKVSKTLVWFNNGWSYAHRVVDLLRRFEHLDSSKEAA